VKARAASKRTPRHAGSDAPLADAHRSPSREAELEELILGDMKVEIDEILDRLGTGIEREQAKMDEILGRLRKSRLTP
jgi:hypothetical protein